MKVFVTGGTGFIGQHLVRLLVQQGHQVHALAGTSDEAHTLRRLGAVPVPGDVTDRASLQAGIVGADVVFHAANQPLAADADPDNAQTKIVAGTQHTLGAAHDLGVATIVFVSDLSILGDTGGAPVDETFVPAQPPAGEIGRALWRAHYEVMLPLLEQGAPIITVMPGVAYGPGDAGWPAQLMRRFYRGTLPAVPAPQTTLTYAYVEDVAQGCILAAERGAPAETYILAGPAVPLGELVEFWARLTGRPAPPLSLPAHRLTTVTPVLDTRTGTQLVAQLGTSTLARADKARQQLGWTTRAMQPATLETFEWIAATEPADTWEKRRHLGLALGGALVALVLLWLLRRRDKGPAES